MCGKHSKIHLNDLSVEKLLLTPWSGKNTYMAKQLWRQNMSHQVKCVISLGQVSQGVHNHFRDLTYTTEPHENLIYKCLVVLVKYFLIIISHSNGPQM